MILTLSLLNALVLLFVIYKLKDFPNTLSVKQIMLDLVKVNTKQVLDNLFDKETSIFDMHASIVEVYYDIKHNPEEWKYSGNEVSSVSDRFPKTRIGNKWNAGLTYTYKGCEIKTGTMEDIVLASIHKSYINWVQVNKPELLDQLK